MTYADVILPVPFEGFTYIVPREMEQQVQRGSRVLVTLGKSRRYAGIVERVHHDAPPAGVQMKSIVEVLNAPPIVNEAQFAFWHWIADYYMAPLGDVYKAAFPGVLKKEEKPKKRRKKSDETEADSLRFEAKNSDAEKAIFPDAFSCQRVQNGSNFAESGSVLPSAAEKLRSEMGENDVFSPQLNELNEAQQEALGAIKKTWAEGKEITLLHGVTSSGKTEIYIHLIAECIRQGKQVLYLLPEIALTTQITNRLRNVFGERLGVYHSKFSDNERAAVYQRQLSGAPFDLILGVRSSVFLPFQRLGLVIVDEEHETSYKQQEPAPRYHARNAALMLARHFGAKTLLGTATPSIETFWHAQQGHYGYVALTRRYSDMQLPAIDVVDIRRLRFQKRMKGAFSQALLDTMTAALERKEQVILFQNRRGFSPVVQCKNCGWVPHCEHCDVSLTLHKRSGRLVCHYCGATYAMPERCPACEESDFMGKGAGTERIEEQVTRHFPDAKISRMDLDTAKTRTAYERIISEFSSGESDILIGTQMVSKGLDFDKVSVVGILDADQLLNFPDFRAHERTFHTLSQVAGRAGRKGHRGQVVLQTRSADLPLMQQVVNNDYEGMYRTQLEEREAFLYPPFCRLISVHLRHRDGQLLDHWAQDYANLLRLSLSQPGWERLKGVRVLGPETPIVSRISSFHIRKILLKVPLQAPLSLVRNLLYGVRDQLLLQPAATNLNVFFDVDPM